MFTSVSEQQLPRTVRGVAMVILRGLFSILRGRNAVSNADDLSTRVVRRHIVPTVDKYAAVQFERLFGRLYGGTLDRMVGLRYERKLFTDPVDLEAGRGWRSRMPTLEEQ